MKLWRLLLVVVLCISILLTSLSGCKAQEPDLYQLQTGRPLGMAGGLSSAVLQVVLGDMASGALSWAAGAGCEFLFGLITGSENEEDAKLDDIIDKLDKMDKKLDDIQKTVKDIQREVQGIISTLEIMKWDDAVRSILKPIDSINMAYEDLSNIVIEDADPATYFDDTNFKNLTKDNCDAVLNFNDGIRIHIKEIASSITPPLEMSSVLYLMYDKVVKRLNDPAKELEYDQRIECYNAFENFFTYLVGIEIKGAQLVVNAYAYLDDSKNANDYLVTFYDDILKPQVELFSRLVENLVWNDVEMGLGEVILDPEPCIFLSADSLTHGLLTTAYVEDGKLKTGEDRGIITARIRYSDETTPLSSIQFINTSSNSEQIITLESEEPTKTESKYNVRVYTYKSPPNGTYKLRTVDHPAILHDYGEKEIVINDANRYGSIGIYAWAPSSDYYQIINRNSNLTIDATGKGDRANIHQWIYYGFDNQLWKFEHVDNGYYKITNKYSGKVLDVLSYSKDDKANIIQYTWNNTTNQRWRLHKVRNGYLVIINENSGKVLDIKDGTRGNGGNLQQFQRRDSGNQTFEIRLADKPATDAGQFWKFIPQSKRDDRLDVRGGYGGQGTVIQTWKKNDTSAQKWKLVWKEGTYYRLTPECDPIMAASVRGNSKSWGAIIQLWTYEKGQPGQLWKFEPVGSGYYRIVNKNSGMVMEQTNDAVHQLKWSDAKDKDTVTWKIIKTSPSEKK